MKVELIGGPWDGDEIEVDPTCRYWRIPLREPLECWQIHDGNITEALDRLRCGVYSPTGNPREFHWRGDERQ